MESTGPLAGPVVIRALGPGSVPAAAQALAGAYNDDPVHALLLPDVARRLRAGRGYFRWLLAEHLRRGRPAAVLTADTSVCGVVVWRSGPGGHPGGDDESAAGRLTPPALRAGGWGGRAGEVFAFCEARRPTHDHVYLELIGVPPGLQRRGLGARLLGHVTSTAATAGLGVWSWSSNPANLSFYRRAGFRVDSEGPVPGGGPTITEISWGARGRG